MAKGTLTLADLQATQNAQTVARVGIDRTFEAITNTLAAHNRIMQEIYQDFVEVTTDESDRYGGVDTVKFEIGDELTVPHPWKVTAGATVGLPLNAFLSGYQWSEMWMKKHTVRELVAQMNAILDADALQLIRDMKRAFFYSSNYTHTDYLNRGIDLFVKRLVNADNQPLPPGPNGEQFPANTHTHYLPRLGGAATVADYDAAVNTVREHYATGEILTVITSADEPAVRALPGFVPYLDPRLTPANTTVNASGVKLNPINFNNRAVGIMSSNGSEVWVKPWGITSYPAFWNPRAPKPIRWRYDTDYGQDLVLIYEVGDRQPLNAKGWRRVYGFGAYNRINGSVLFTGGTVYADPVIN